MRFIKGISVVIVFGCLRSCLTDSYHPRRVTRSTTTPTNSAVNFQNWEQIAQDELKASLNVVRNTKRAKNVIFFIGDGMGVSTLTAARFYQAQTTNRSIDQSKLSWENLPQTGIIKTYNVDAQTPDSAGTGTAYNCGQKAPYGTIGVNQHVTRGNCSSMKGNELKSALHVSMEAGKWAGIVTTTRITHATPAASYSHSPERNWESDGHMPATDRQGPCIDIARQLIEEDINKDIRVILGGGREMFLSNNTKDPEYPEKYGTRLDDKNLIEVWKSNRNYSEVVAKDNAFQYVTNRGEFDKVDPAEAKYLFGLFEPGHMQYEADRDKSASGDPSLTEMVKKAIQMLSRSEEGFYLYVEGGRIDHAHHENNAKRSLIETVSLSEAVQLAMDMTDEEDTLIAVTADHSHTFTMGGYPQINNDILGLVHDVNDVDGGLSDAEDGKPWLTLAYANGPGHRYHYGNESHARKNMTGDNTDSIDYLQPAGFYRDSETHGGEDVAIFARGPMSHLFVGTHEQHYIPHVLLYASCLDTNNDDHCNNPTASTAGTITLSLFQFTLIFILFS